jgi:hypothetical protein
VLSRGGSLRGDRGRRRRRGLTEWWVVLPQCKLAVSIPRCSSVI